jgi:hypothetical protein
MQALVNKVYEEMDMVQGSKPFIENRLIPNANHIKKGVFPLIILSMTHGWKTKGREKIVQWRTASTAISFQKLLAPIVTEFGTVSPSSGSSV